jgi:hypothetical protein
MREHLPRIVRHASTPSPIASVWCAHQYSTNASPEPSSECKEMNNRHLSFQASPKHTASQPTRHSITNAFDQLANQPIIHPTSQPTSEPIIKYM